MKQSITIRTVAALLVAGLAFVSCTKDEPAYTGTTYTMSVKASKGGNAMKQLTFNGSTYVASWATTENVYVQKGDTWASGALQPQANGTEVWLKGDISGVTIEAGNTLNLQFPHSGVRDYSGQKGTIDDIAANYDYATASVTVESVSATGVINVGGTTEFANQQAIVKFTLLDKGNSDAAISPSALTVTDGTSTVELTSIPAATYTANGASNVLYVAFPAAGSAKTVTLRATVGGDTYIYQKSGVTFTNGQYYEITVKMTKQYKMAAAATSADKGKLICTDGHIHAYGADAACTKARVAKIIYIGTTGHATYSHGLALALTDEAGTMAWQAAINACSAKNTSTPVTGARWLLASMAQWDYMLGASGAGSYTALRDGFSGISGASNLQSYYYWSSTEYDSSQARDYYFASGGWKYCSKSDPLRVRACLAF